MDNVWENKQKILSRIKNLILKNEFIEDIADTRNTICSDCEYKSTKCAALISSCCTVCGCSLKFKTRSLEASCPKDKWPALDDKQ